jgi:hypothetical protein
MVWAGPGLLAVITGDLSVRCWDLDTGESYLLDAEPLNSSPPASDSPAGASNLPTEIFTSLAFCPQKGEILFINAVPAYYLRLSGSTKCSGIVVNHLTSI